MEQVIQWLRMYYTVNMTISMVLLLCLAFYAVVVKKAVISATAKILSMGYVVVETANPALTSLIDFVVIQRKGDTTYTVLVERVYREGLCIVENLTAEEIEAGSQDPWRFWNNERAISIEDWLLKSRDHRS